MQRLWSVPAVAVRFHARLLLVLMTLCMLCGNRGVALASGDGQEIPVKVVTMITADDKGVQYRFPSQVFYDATMDEIYVLANGKLNIYGSDFYPLLSLGAGRGAEAPQGGYVDREGRLYLCQSSHGAKPARLTIYNAAFFVEREVLFNGFAGADTFQPVRVAVSSDGIIYLAGLQDRGVLVLDSDGKFLRWLRPEDRIFGKEAIREALEIKARDEGGEAKAIAESSAEQDRPAEENPVASLPPELLPKAPKEEKDEANFGVAPVMIKDVAIDSEGHIYLLSEETSKVYVYSPNESLLFTFGEKGGAFGKMSRPRGLAVDEKKKCVYIVDYMRHSVLIFDLAGKFMHEIGGMGAGPGWFSFPNDVALNRKGELLVADLFNNRVQVLDVQFQSRFPLFGTTAPKTESDGADSAGSAAAGEEGQPQPPEAAGGAETSLPEPIVPAQETKEEFLSTTGNESPGQVVVSPRESGPEEPDIVEEPIGAYPRVTP
ncbi:MAG: NHL repeat-containing protein [Desulfobulbaceae bacterium]|nr:NHL repeat-containing protein [Desulfobulbaceae bacterium]